MKRKLNVGIIGFGFMGTTHLGVYRNLADVRVAAIADIDPRKRRGDVSKVVCNIGDRDTSKPIDLTGVDVYDDAMKLIREADVDIVDICVPTAYHAELVCAALAAGKHVFCEKPITVNYALSCEMKEEADRQGKMLNIGVCNRYQKSVEMLEEYNRQGKFGNIYHVYCSFRSFRSIRRKSRCSKKQNRIARNSKL